MAVELLSENSSISPRISFSRDFCNSDIIPIEQRPLRSPSSKPSSHSSSIDFDFCIPGGFAAGESFDQASWSADEIFSDGKILPTDIKKRPEPKPVKPGPGRSGTQDPQPGRPGTRVSQQGRGGRTEKQGKKGAVTGDDEGNDDVSVPAEEKHNTKSFWGFKRSSSLNCGSGYGRSLCPIPLLSRSNSTGSTPTSVNKQKQSTRKQTEHAKIHFSSSSSSSSSNSSSSNNGSNHGSQKPPLKKNYGGYSYGNNGGVGVSGTRVNPVLNVVPSGNLFGLGSIFGGSGRDKNKKRYN